MVVCEVVMLTLVSAVWWCECAGFVASGVAMPQLIIWLPLGDWICISVRGQAGGMHHSHAKALSCLFYTTLASTTVWDKVH